MNPELHNTTAIPAVAATVLSRIMPKTADGKMGKIYLSKDEATLCAVAGQDLICRFVDGKLTGVHTICNVVHDDSRWNMARNTLDSALQFIDTNPVAEYWTGMLHEGSLIHLAEAQPYSDNTRSIVARIVCELFPEFLNEHAVSELVESASPETSVWWLDSDFSSPVAVPLHKAADVILDDMVSTKQLRSDYKELEEELPEVGGVQAFRVGRHTEQHGWTHLSVVLFEECDKAAVAWEGSNSFWVDASDVAEALRAWEAGTEAT